MLDDAYKLKLKRLAQERRDISFARGQLTNALKYGRLKKEPCKCGSTKVEGHHPDYSRPLEVIWACKKHHAELDKYKRELDLEKTTGIILHPSYAQLSSDLSTKKKRK